MLVRDELLQAPALLLLRHRLVPAPRLRVGPRRVLEQERAVVADVTDVVARGLEVRFGLAREADDDVGGERQVGDRGAQAIDDALVVGQGVRAIHRAQHRVRTRLQRQVHLRHDGAALRHRRDHAPAHVARMRGREADAREPLHPARGPQQVGEVVRAVVVGVHGLAQEHDLPETLRHGRPYLAYQVRERQTAFAAAGVGDDAVGAELVAAALDGDPGAHARLALGLEVAVGLVAVEPRVRDRFPGRAPEQVGKRAVAVGAHDQVEHARLVEQSRAEVLGHAAGDADDQVRVAALEPGEVPEPPQHALLGVLADRAGVEDHRVGVLGTIGEAHARAQQHARHQFAVGHVHLAAVGLEEHTLHVARR